MIVTAAHVMLILHATVTFLILNTLMTIFASLFSFFLAMCAAPISLYKRFFRNIPTSTVKRLERFGIQNPATKGMYPEAGAGCHEVRSCGGWMLSSYVYAPLTTNQTTGIGPTLPHPKFHRAHLNRILFGSHSRGFHQGSACQPWTRDGDEHP